jgi:hypothetical protein
VSKRLLPARLDRDYLGISTLAAALLCALNCSGFKNITEHREQA